MSKEIYYDSDNEYMDSWICSTGNVFLLDHVIPEDLNGKTGEEALPLIREAIASLVLDALEIEQWMHRQKIYHSGERIKGMIWILKRAAQLAKGDPDGVFRIEE